MKTFEYSRAGSLPEALAALAEPGTALMAGGTELVNWLKEGIATPGRLVDITGLGLGEITVTDGVLRLGALAKMSDVAEHPAVRERYPVLSEALLRGASAQIRNAATMGGNLMQRTRCPYFRADVPLPCNKRAAGSGCSARHGDTSGAAIFGWTDDCVATHPSDMAVALAALDAAVLVEGPAGGRRIPLVEFHRLPGSEPARHNELAPDEIIIGIEVPASLDARRSHYLKVRERVSYEFAVVSAAAIVALDGVTITAARLAMGGVAHRPWRLREAEDALPGRDVTDSAAVLDAIGESFTGARALPDNGYKLTLAPRAAMRALRIAAGVDA